MNLCMFGYGMLHTHEVSHYRACMRLNTEYRHNLAHASRTYVFNHQIMVGDVHKCCIVFRAYKGTSTVFTRTCQNPCDPPGHACTLLDQLSKLYPMGRASAKSERKAAQSNATSELGRIDDTTLAPNYRPGDT